MQMSVGMEEMPGAGMREGAQSFLALSRCTASLPLPMQTEPEVL